MPVTGVQTCALPICDRARARDAQHLLPLGIRVGTLTQLYLREGEESEAWISALGTLDDLVWSVQPKRLTEDRRKLVAMLRNLLKQLHGGLHNVAWEQGERETFMSNLVEAHAAAVKPSLASTPLPTVAVAEAATAAAERASRRRWRIMWGAS